MTTLTTPLTTTHLAILVVAIVIVGAILSLAFLPGYRADRRRWERIEAEEDEQLSAGAARRFMEKEGRYV